MCRNCGDEHCHSFPLQYQLLYKNAFHNSQQTNVSLAMNN